MNLPLALALDAPRIHNAQEAFFSMGFVAAAFAAGTALIVSMLGILYMTLAIAPNATLRFSSALRERNILSFFAGLGVTLGTVLLLALTHKVHALAATIFAGFGVALIPAFAAGAEDVGRRLFWACGKEGSRASHLASGWLVFAFGSLVPWVGWCLIFPYVTLSGLGSLVVGLFTAPRPPRDIEFTGEEP
jgi:hypothetical protein